MAAAILTDWRESSTGRPHHSAASSEAVEMSSGGLDGDAVVRSDATLTMKPD